MIKKIHILGIIIAISIVTVGCGNVKSTEDLSVIDSPTEELTASDTLLEKGVSSDAILEHEVSGKSDEVDILFEINSEADRAYNYENLASLVNAASDIFLGKVVSAEARMQDTFVYTKYEVEVTEVFFGDIVVGNTVEVSVLGGVINAEEYMARVNMEKDFEPSYSIERVKTGYVKSTWDGAWLMEEGEEYLLFTQYIPFGNEMVYSPLNTWQGIFGNMNGTLQRYQSDVSNSRFQNSIQMEQLEQLKSISE